MQIPWLMILALISIIGAANGDTVIVHLKEYNVTFDAGDAHYNLTDKDKHYSADSDHWNGLSGFRIDIEFNGSQKFTYYIDDEAVTPKVTKAEIHIGFGDLMSFTDQYGSFHSGSFKRFKEEESEFTSLPESWTSIKGKTWDPIMPENLDNLSNEPWLGGRHSDHPLAVYKNLTIDGREGRLMTRDGSTDLLAIYYVSPEDAPGEYAVIDVGFGGWGLHSLLGQEVSAEEIQFKVSYFEAFLKTIHIERKGEISKTSLFASNSLDCLVPPVAPRLYPTGLYLLSRAS